MSRTIHLIVAAGVALLGAAHGQDTLSWSSRDGFYRLNLAPSAQATLWAGDSPAPGLLDIPDDTFLAPRAQVELSLALGSHLFLHANTRWDRGFDTGNEPDGEVRVDELFARWRFFEDERLRLQVGKFPTVFGAWVGQHDFFDDPFLIPPLAYGQVIGVQTRNAAALAPAALEARSSGKAPAFSTLSKQNWASIIWGPSYASGLALSGSSSHWDYAVELKNAALSSHSDAWNPNADDFSHPMISGRLGYRPDAAWAFGLSASHGPYLDSAAESTLPPGQALEGLDQTTLGLDLRWAHHAWVVSGEVIASRFETAASGDLDVLTWHLQARYKVAPGFWIAVRGGQLLSDSAHGPDGKSLTWSPDVWRAEVALGWRLTEHLLVKADYSLTQTSGPFPAGEHLVGLGVGWRF